MAMISGSPWISKWPRSSIARMPPSLTLPATIPEAAEVGGELMRGLIPMEVMPCSRGWVRRFPGNRARCAGAS